MMVRDETAKTPAEMGAETREAEAYSLQYVEDARGEPAHWPIGNLDVSLSQRRIGGCSRITHE